MSFLGASYILKLQIGLVYLLQKYFLSHFPCRNATFCFLYLGQKNWKMLPSFLSLSLPLIPLFRWEIIPSPTFGFVIHLSYVIVLRYVVQELASRPAKILNGAWKVFYCFNPHFISVCLSLCVCLSFCLLYRFCPQPHIFFLWL